METTHKRRVAVSVIATGFAATVGLGSVGTWWWGWARAPGASEVRAVLDSFPAPSRWTQVETVTRGRSPLCVDVACPGGLRRWASVRSATADDLVELARRAGWRIEGVDGNCLPKPNRTGPLPLCTLKASAKNLGLSLSIIGSQTVSEDALTAVLIVSE